MFMNNIETLTPSTFICLPKVTVLWLMIISLFLLQFYNIYNMYYLFSVLVLTMVYLVLSQVFVELHTVLFLPMSDTDIAVICDTWIKSLHIFLRSRFFFRFFFFYLLAKIKVPCESFRGIFFPVLLIIHASVKQCYENIWYKEIDSSHFSSVYAGFYVGCTFLSPYNNPRKNWPDLPIGEVNWTLQVHVSLSIASLNLQH